MISSVLEPSRLIRSLPAQTLYFKAEIIWCTILCVPYWDFRHTCTSKNAHLMILFSEIMNQIVYLKWALAICKTWQFINLQGNVYFQIFPFYSIATQLFSYTIFCAPHKSIFGLVHDTNNVHKIFSALNVTIIFIKPSNNLFSILYEWNIIYPLPAF